MRSYFAIRRRYFGRFGEVHNSRDPLAPRRLSSLLAMKTKTPRCPFMASGYASKLRLFTWIQSLSEKYRIKPLQPFIKLTAYIRWCGRDPPSSVSVPRPYDRRAMFRPALGAGAAPAAARLGSGRQLGLRRRPGQYP